MTCAEFEELRERAGGRCELCGVLERFTPQGVLFIDHDNPVGRHAVRGLLCNRCNSGFENPRVAGPERDAYLAGQWYLSSAVRQANGLTAADMATRIESALADLDLLTERFAAGEATSEVVLSAAVAALRMGASPGSVYRRTPFTATYIRARARAAGVAAGRPGVKVQQRVPHGDS
jgi:hypothetical protein